ncbi:MAG: hypothetical protein ACLQVD_06905 [Capsulimonadaceae bacterium]
MPMLQDDTITPDVSPPADDSGDENGGEERAGVTSVSEESRNHAAGQQRDGLDSPAPAVATGKVRKPKKAVTIEERERDVVGSLIVLVVALTTLPHWFGFSVAQKGARFAGSAFNIDDHLVYLSWLQQTVHGQVYTRSLFTTDVQPAPLINYYYVFLGWLGRVTHWPGPIELEVVRAVSGALLLLLIYRFYCSCIPTNRAARLTAFGFACLGSGFGWTTWRSWSDMNRVGAPIDAWQPEAYTFMSIYFDSMFVVSTMLIIGVLFGMLMAARTGRMRYAWIAGACGFLLGDIHTYDIVHVTAAWGLFLLAWTAVRWRRGVRRLWVHSLMAFTCFLPTTLFVAYCMEINPTFHARAVSPTYSPPFWHYLLGYGLVMVFAAVAVGMLIWRRRYVVRCLEPTALDVDEPEGCESVAAHEIGWADRASLLFISCWAVAGFFVIRIPVEWQRKAIMGEDIPLCLLAGWGAASLMRPLAKPLRITLLTLLVLASFVSNGFVIRRDLVHISRNRSETATWPVLSSTLVHAIDYIRTSTPSYAAVVSMPSLAIYVPAFSGHAVWAGHWSETPDYTDKVRAIAKFTDSNTPDSDRQDFLRSLPVTVQYLLYPNKVDGLQYTSGLGAVHTFADFVAAPPPYLVAVYSNKDFTIFRIDLSRAGAVHP